MGVGIVAFLLFLFFQGQMIVYRLLSKPFVFPSLFDCSEFFVYRCSIQSLHGQREAVKAELIDFCSIFNYSYKHFCLKSGKGFLK